MVVSYYWKDKLFRISKLPMPIFGSIATAIEFYGILPCPPVIIHGYFLSAEKFLLILSND